MGDDRGRALVITAGVRGLVAMPTGVDLVVAANGGCETALRNAWHVDAVIGDQDSLSHRAHGWAQSCGAEFHSYPSRKDETDLELALAYACERRSDVHVLATAGGRLDHALANILTLASPRWSPTRVTASVDKAYVEVIRGTGTLVGPVGDVVTLLAIGGAARVLATHGLEFPLNDETLHPMASRGVSNTIVSAPAQITVSEGVVVAIYPGGLSDL